MSLRSFLISLLKLNGVFLGIEFLWRLAFLFFFGAESLATVNSSDLLSAFILGARFDLTVLCYINAIPLLMLFFWSIYQTTLPVWFRTSLFIWYSLFLFVMTFFNLIDFGFYSFFQDRINLLIFGFFEDDTIALIKTMWKNYPVIPMASFLVIFAWLLQDQLRRLFNLKKINSEPLSSPAPSANIEAQGWSHKILVAFLLFTVFFINGLGARGSLGLFPLSEMDTGISSNPFINQLGFNSSRAFARAVELRMKSRSEWNSNLKYFGYAENPRKAFADYFEIPEENIPQDPVQLLRKVTPHNPWAEQTRPHVVFVLMESWGSYWMQFSDPSFDLVGDFKKHQLADLYTDKVLSQTAATIGTLSSLMAGIPHRHIGEFLSESSYLQAPFRTSPARIFKKSGYQTRFIYGGNPGWREINKFASFQGYDSVEGESEISKKLGSQLEKHDWGIYDGDLWKYVELTLKESTTPQFLVVMTTSNHPPFQTPQNYKIPTFHPPEFVKVKYIGDTSIPPKRYATYRYAMDEFSLFLDRLKSSPLADKTILAATGDHAFWMINFNETEQLQKNAVPMYLYLPPAIRGQRQLPEYANQNDILPTLYPLALSKTEIWTLGFDLFSNPQNFTHGAERLVIGPTGGVAPGSHPAYYNWRSGESILVAGQEDEQKIKMTLKYNSLMSLLDLYMLQEKNSENSRR